MIPEQSWSDWHLWSNCKAHISNHLIRVFLLQQLGKREWLIRNMTDGPAPIPECVREREWEREKTLVCFISIAATPPFCKDVCMYYHSWSQKKCVCVCVRESEWVWERDTHSEIALAFVWQGPLIINDWGLFPHLEHGEVIMSRGHLERERGPCGRGQRGVLAGPLL